LEGSQAKVEIGKGHRDRRRKRSRTPSCCRAIIRRQRPAAATAAGAVLRRREAAQSVARCAVSTGLSFSSDDVGGHLDKDTTCNYTERRRSRVDAPRGAIVLANSSSLPTAHRPRDRRAKRKYDLARGPDMTSRVVGPRSRDYRRNGERLERLVEA